MTAEIIFRGKRILAVDDEPDVLALITEGLHDVEVVTAGDFEHARRIIEGEKFHLVLLDIMGVNGFELLKMCTERKLPAAMLTARAITIDSVNLSLKLGAVSFLPKEELANMRNLWSRSWRGWSKEKAIGRSCSSDLGRSSKKNSGYSGSGWTIQIHLTPLSGTLDETYPSGGVVCPTSQMTARSAARKS